MFKFVSNFSLRTLIFDAFCLMLGMHWPRSSRAFLAFDAIVIKVRKSQEN